MIVIQYANNGSLPSYLDQNINELTWMDKLWRLRSIAYDLKNIHGNQLIHCDLHGGNIVLNNNKGDDRITSFICDLGLSKSVNSPSSDTNIHGVLAYIAPEVLQARKFTQKSDIYSFGIIMHQFASGEPPFRDYSSDEHLAMSSDEHLAMRICNGLRPEMPDLAPKEYKELAARCCETDPNRRPNAEELFDILDNLHNEI